jgi:hypothetical protein
VQDLEQEGIIENGNVFDWSSKAEMENYISKNAKGRYVYDGNPNSDTTWVIFSKIKLPKADKIV